MVDTPLCPNCGQPVEAEKQICANCGAIVSALQDGKLLTGKDWLDAILGFSICGLSFIVAFVGLFFSLEDHIIRLNRGNNSHLYGGYQYHMLWPYFTAGGVGLIISVCLYFFTRRRWVAFASGLGAALLTVLTLSLGGLVLCTGDIFSQRG